jgi:hypothetical protein
MIEGWWAIISMAILLALPIIVFWDDDFDQR